MRSSSPAAAARHRLATLATVGLAAATLVLFVFTLTVAFRVPGLRGKPCNAVESPQTSPADDHKRGSGGDARPPSAAAAGSTPRDDEPRGLRDDTRQNSSTGTVVVTPPSKARCSTSASAPLRVAVCFYGLNRSLRHTINSLRRHLYAPLADACVRVDTFFHTWTLKALADRHNGEGGVPLGGPIEELALLGGPDVVTRYSIDDQDLFDADFRDNFTAYGKIDTRYKGPNMKNMLRQLESLRRVTRLWRLQAASDTTRAAARSSSSSSASVSSQKKDYYRAVLYVRPDLLLLDDVDVAQLVGLGRREVLTPYWHQYSGLNDRVAAGTERVARVFGERIRETWDYAQWKFIRSESFLKWVMLNHSNFEPVSLLTRAQRMRATGQVADNDVCLSWCSIAQRKFCRGDCRRVMPPDLAPPRPKWAILQQERDVASGKIPAPPGMKRRQHSRQKPHR